MSGWEAAWRDLLGVSDIVSTPTLAIGVAAVMFVACVVPAAHLYWLLEKKATARMQARVGPNQAGPRGVLQPLADALKLLGKRSSARVTPMEEMLRAFLVGGVAATVVALPLGSLVLMVETEMSAALPFLVLSVLAYGLIFLGIRQGKALGQLGGMRVAAQAVAGMLPALLAVTCAATRAEGLGWTRFSEAQGAGAWIALADPFQFGAFLVFIASGMVLLNRAPTDAGFSGGSLRSGIAAGFYGTGFGLYALGRFYLALVWCVLAAVIFCGGWNLPGVVASRVDHDASALVRIVLEAGVLLVKAVVLMWAMAWIGKVTPRAGLEQALGLGWRVLSTLAMVCLMGTSLWIGAGVFF